MGEMATVKLQDGRQVKLGRIRPKQVLHGPRFTVVVHQDDSVHVVSSLVGHYDVGKDNDPPPPTVDYSAKAMDSLSHMYLNDTYGDCVIASKYHNEGTVSGNEEGKAIVATDDEVLNSYHTICGPGDNGCNITDVLDYWKNTGLVFTGKTYKIDGYVSVDWTNQTLVQVAIDLFGGLTLGINLPNDWTNAGPGVKWDVTNSQIVGGHDVFAYGYNADGVLISTWGKVGTVITWKAFLQKKWVEESYASLSPNWYDAGNIAPNGIDAKTLSADLAAIGSGQTPNITPINPPPPPPPAPGNVTAQQAIKWAQDGLKAVAHWYELDVLTLAGADAAVAVGISQNWPTSKDDANAGTLWQTFLVMIEGLIKELVNVLPAGSVEIVVQMIVDQLMTAYNVPPEIITAVDALLKQYLGKQSGLKNVPKRLGR